MLNRKRRLSFNKIFFARPEIKHTNSKAIITLYSAPLRECCGLRKLQTHFSDMWKTLSLGSERKLMLNIACLEKAQRRTKLLVGISGSVRGDMDRAKLLELKSPVPSKLGG